MGTTILWIAMIRFYCYPHHYYYPSQNIDISPITRDYFNVVLTPYANLVSNDFGKVIKS